MNLSIFQPIRDWLTTQVERYTSSGSEVDPTQSLSEHTPVELPTALELELSQAIQNLSPHPVFYQSIEGQLKSSLRALTQHPEAPNSLVILGNPSDVLPLTVHHHLEDWLRNSSNLYQDLKNQDLKNQENKSDRPSAKPPLISLCAHWNHRPSDARDIVSQLTSELQNLESTLESDPQPLESPRTPPIVFLPLLEWCFLRCVDGFEGIELLIDYVLGDRSRFWVMGCNSWAWTYLDQVCHISTYFEQTMMLPSLGRYELKEWLSPIAEKVDLVMDVKEDDKPKPHHLHRDFHRDDDDDEPDKWVSNQEKRFYEKLASDSHGLSKIAADLWLRSLCVAEEDEPTDEPTDGPTGESERADSTSREHSDEKPNPHIWNENSENHPSEKQDVENPHSEQDSEQERSSGSSAGSSDESFSSPDRPDPALAEPQWPRLEQHNVSSPRLFPLEVGDRHILYSVLLHGQISVSHLARSLGDDESIVRAKVQLLLRAGILNRRHDLIQVDPAYYLSIRSDLERNNFLVGDISS
ncbi:MAG: hypothetical protein VKL39_19475 [Leptolyngbyaceae bacterium]|nr:hypothetical protein [Leptolyngbyaceae bacterium]